MKKPIRKEEVVSLRLSKELLKHADAAARESGLSRSDWYRYVIAKALAERKS